MAEIEMTLGWVIAYVDDPAAAAAFYDRTFGLRKEFVVPGEYAQMNTGPTKLGFATYALARDPFGMLVELAPRRCRQAGATSTLRRACRISTPQRAPHASRSGAN